MSPVFFPLPNVPFIWKHSGVPYSDWQCSSNSSIKLPCHMSRLVWLCVWVQTEFWLAAGLMGSPHGWNSCTLKSWVVGHMLSLLIHQLTATMITVEMGGGVRWWWWRGLAEGVLQKKKKGQEGGKQGWQEGSHMTWHVQPLQANLARSAGVEVEVMWLCLDLHAQTQYVGLPLPHIHTSAQVLYVQVKTCTGYTGHSYSMQTRLNSGSYEISECGCWTKSSRGWYGNIAVRLRYVHIRHSTTE